MVVVLFSFPLNIISSFSYQHNYLRELNLSQLLKVRGPFSTGFPSATQFIFGFELSDTTCLPQVWFKECLLENIT